jgi:hypothetical protein
MAMAFTSPSSTGRRSVARPGSLLLACLLLVSAAPRAMAADVEQRDFVTSVDGKPAGEYHMTISTQEDGTVTMAGHADVTVKHLIRTYRYTYRGTEVWREGRLVRLDSTCNDDGKQYTVAAVADREVLRVRVNGREPRLVRPDVWVTTYWRLPDAKARNQSLPLLDADTGRDMAGTLQYLDMSAVTVAGQPVNCAHYRAVGALTVDLWYDGQDRLVRQEWVEDGLRIVLELARLAR